MAAASSEPSSLAAIGLVTAVPAVAMALGSAAISAGEPSETMQARMQHLSAGLLMGAVMTDIFPLLRSRLFTESEVGLRRQVNVDNLVAALIGFALALLLMYGLKALELGGEDEESAKQPAVFAELADANSSQATEPLLGAASPSPSPSLTRASRALAQDQVLNPEELHRLRSALDELAARGIALAGLVAAEQIDREKLDEQVHSVQFVVDSARRQCRGTAAGARTSARLRLLAIDLDECVRKVQEIDSRDLPAVDAQLRVIANALRNIHTHEERAVFRRWSLGRLEPATPSVAGDGVVLPWSFVLAVVVDSTVDGMLIGLAGSVALMSGWLLALATAIEMGFLGFSFTCAVTKACKGTTAVLLSCLPPLTMMLASLVAAVGAGAVADRPALVGLIAFALVAVLFMVVDELLMEAQEKEENQTWHVSSWLYIGLLLSICLDIML